MKFKPLIITSIATFFFLSSCSIAPKRTDYSNDPLKITTDKISQSSSIASNQINQEQIQAAYAGKDDVFMNPFLNIKDNTVAVTVFVNAHRKKNGAVFFDAIHTLCDDELPITRSQKFGENWQKDLRTYSESAFIILNEKQVQSILNCKNSLTIRVTSSSRLAESTYTKNVTPLYFQGLRDLKEKYDSLVSQKYKTK